MKGGKLFLLRALLVVQILAALVFLVRFLGEIFGVAALRVSWEVHELIELGTVLSLIIGSVSAFYLLAAMMRRNAQVEGQLKLASGEFAELLSEKFEEWELTDTEKEVAVLSLKGFSVAEVADMRGKSLGTIKAQNASVYRKAEVTGRAQLMASLMEDLLDHALISQTNLVAAAPTDLLPAPDPQRYQ